MRLFTLSTIFRKHDIVDYYDSRRISCGLVLEVEERKLRILNDLGKETRISSNRALAASQDPDFPLNGSKDAQVSRLKAISNERDTIKSRIDLRELWEIVGVETEEISLKDLSDLLFGNQNDADSSASLLRAIFEDKLYFRVRPDKIEVPPPDRVQQALIQREKENERAQFCARAAEFLSHLKNSHQINMEEAPESLVPLLEQAALTGAEWISIKQAKDIFSQAGIIPGWDPFKVLVKLGVWSEDENITLRAENIPVDFSSQTETLAAQAALKPLPESVEDHTSDHLITIDSVFTRDVDDALSIAKNGDEVTIGIHITDVAHLVEHNSELDGEIRHRATSIYLPEMTIPMIPRVLSEQAASLKVAEVRPAISAFVSFGQDLSLKSFRIVESIVKVSERLSYEDADERIAKPDTREALMYAVASAVRKARVKAGAIIFRDPELFVHVGEDGTIEVNTRDRETPSQVLVSEMMILGNTLFARFLKEREIPAIFRSQPPPLEKIELGDEYDPVVSYRSKKALSRGDLSTQPASHSTLGLEVYTTGTSPLRRYTDLLIQRQLKAALSQRAPLDITEIEKNLMEISSRLERASLLERERQRYFLLRYLEGKRDQEFECVVLQRFPKFYLVQITALGFNAALHVPPSFSMAPHDRCLARIEKINPRAEKLSLSLVKLLET